MEKDIPQACRTLAFTSPHQQSEQGDRPGRQRSFAKEREDRAFIVASKSLCPAWSSCQSASVAALYACARAGKEYLHKSSSFVHILATLIIVITSSVKPLQP